MSDPDSLTFFFSLVGVFLSFLVGVAYQDKGGVSGRRPTILKPHNE